MRRFEKPNGLQSRKHGFSEMATQFQKMLQTLNDQNRKADEAAAVCKKPPPGSKEPGPHPIIRMHTALGRIKHDPPNLFQSLRRP